MSCLTKLVVDTTRKAGAIPYAIDPTEIGPQARKKGRLRNWYKGRMSFRWLMPVICYQTQTQQRTSLLSEVIDSHCLVLLETESLAFERAGFAQVVYVGPGVNVSVVTPTCTEEQKF
jgi:hypothetical protein